MSRIFDNNGNHIAVTLLQCQDTAISRIKTANSKDGYDAYVVEVKSNKANGRSKTYEFRAENTEQYKIGDQINATIFTENDKVTVESVSKGKGFAGTIKRYGFHRGPKTHGSHNVRQPGSIGGGYPQRVVAGKRMAGRMGGDNVTVKNLKIMAIDINDNIIAVSGAVPGPNNKIVKIVSK